MAYAVAVATTSFWLLNFKGTLIALHASTDLNSIEICDPKLENTKTLTKFPFSLGHKQLFP